MFNKLCELRMHMTSYAILYDVNIVLVLPPRFCGLPCPSNLGNLESTHSDYENNNRNNGAATNAWRWYTIINCWPKHKHNIEKIVCCRDPVGRDELNTVESDCVWNTVQVKLSETGFKFHDCNDPTDHSSSASKVYLGKIFPSPQWRRPVNCKVLLRVELKLREFTPGRFRVHVAVTNCTHRNDSPPRTV